MCIRDRTVGTLRLWQCEAEKELDFDAFNAQDYYKALENKNKAEDITRVLYPNDSTWEGKRLRIKQQYVLSLSLIHILPIGLPGLFQEINKVKRSLAEVAHAVGRGEGGDAVS